MVIQTEIYGRYMFQNTSTEKKKTSEENLLSNGKSCELSDHNWFGGSVND
jgi:hypothetical protein